MPFYVGHYLQDTHHLSRSEHGAYLLLLFAMWSAGGTLPANDKNLSKLAHCTLEEWREIRSVILAFFDRDGAKITHGRLVHEMARYQNKVEKAKLAGKASAYKRSKKNKGKRPTDVQQTFNQNPTKEKDTEVIAPTEQITSGRDAPVLPCEGQPASAPVVFIRDLPKAERDAIAATATVGLGRRSAH